MKLSDIVVQAIAKDGLKAVADKIGVHETALSRFQSNRGGLSVSRIDRLFEHVGIVIMTEREHIRKDQIHMRDRETLRRMCELWLEMMPKNGPRSR